MVPSGYIQFAEDGGALAQNTGKVQTRDMVSPIDSDDYFGESPVTGGESKGSLGENIDHISHYFLHVAVEED